MRRAVLTLAAALLWGCVAEEKPAGPRLQAPIVAAVDPREIVIGVAGPMSGEYAAYGTQLRNGAEQAIADINAAGGVGGKRLRLEIGDDGCDPRRAAAVARMLVEKGATMIGGHFCSSSSIAASDVYARSEAVMITPASTNWRLTTEAARKGWTHVFRTASNDVRQGAFAGHWLANTYRARRIAIVHDGSSYGETLAAELKRTLNAAGIEEILWEQIVQDSGGSDELVSRIRAAQADAVYFGGYAGDAAQIVRRLRGAGSRALFMGPEAIVADEFWRTSGRAGQGTVMTFPPDPRRHPMAQPVVARFRARGIDPDGYTLYAYAAIQVWAEAARRAQGFDRARISAAIRGGRFDTVMGSIVYDAIGDLVDPPLAVYFWNNGAYATFRGRS